MRNLENRLSALEQQMKPVGRHFYVWKDSETHRQAEVRWQPGDVIHVIRWLEWSEAESEASPQEGRLPACG
jgi:hypothetical protein